MKDFDREYHLEVVKRDPETGDPVTRPGPDGTQVAVMETIRVSRVENAAGERTFKIGGESFTHRPAVAPEAVLRWYKMGAGELPGLTEDDGINVMDETIRAFLLPGQEDKWGAVRSADHPHPINLTDMRALIRWLFEETTGRPTAPRSDSLGGSESAATGTSSTAASSSQPAAA